ncbi:MAG: DNA mismatch repair protein MutS, partial [Betaproteobacteria bacterium]|nr:DNA mismatch repair protein MutS [Betaproteobacteria bacterium]
SDNLLLALAPDESIVGLAWLNLASGELRVAEIARHALAHELRRIGPAEILVADGSAFADTLTGFSVTRLPHWHFDREGGIKSLLAQLGAATLAGYGCDDMDAAIGACGALLEYARKTQGQALAHVTAVRAERAGEYVRMDGATRRNLEISETLRGERAPTLFSLLDECATGMGSRLLRHWLHHPLRDRAALEARHAAVAALIESQAAVHIAKVLRRFADVERISGRVALKTARPRDLSGLRDSLERLPELIACVPSDAPLLVQLGSELVPPRECCDLLKRSLRPEPAALLREGGVIAEGWSAALDELRALDSNSGEFLAALEARERERTGIPNLKVEYNRVHGFYIEVTNANTARVPAEYRRRQTLKNAERYITPELKSFEDKALSARERSLALEKSLYEDLLARLAEHIPLLQRIARALARIDLLACFAAVAARRSYRRPQFAAETLIEIDGGRHPVVEDAIENFIANDTRLSAIRRLLLITGPNMGGKSTYMRQVALIALMAHVGAFVPARAARIGPIDQIFTRIGAADDLAGGRSTFMVEMTESANILHNATPASLVLLDEVGRGTSTFDGLALAWAIARHILERNRSLALFATHYFEMTRLALEYREAANIHLDAVEHKDTIVFLHAVEEGPASQSYGLQVASLAGVPKPVIRNARRILQQLEEASLARGGQPDLFASATAEPEPAPEKDAAGQALREALDALNPDDLSPREALETLYRLKKL